MLHQLQNLKTTKKVFMIYVASATKPQNYKKSIHDICYSCMFRCCINGKGNLYPSVISKKHPPSLYISKYTAQQLS